MTYTPDITTKVSSENSSTSTLAGDASFTGTGVEVKDYKSITVSIRASHKSANSGVSIEFSQDNTNWDISMKDTYMMADSQYSKTFPVRDRYFRIVYTNDSTLQTTFRLQCMLNRDVDSSVAHSIVQFPDEMYDAFARVRMSEPHTLFQVKHTHDKNELKMVEKITGTGSSTHQSDESCVDISVFANSDKVTRQSTRYISYQPGKSLLIFMTGVLDSNSNGSDVTSRIGYFDDDNGVFFYHKNGTTGVALRSKVTGSVVTTEVPSTSWSLDPMDGTGTSGMNLNAAKAQIFLFDIEWLGVGRVRCGYVAHGKIYYCHCFHHANIVTTTYMTTATLPLRYEIEATGATGPSGTMKCICATAISEGGFEVQGNPFTGGRGRDQRGSLGSTEVPLCAFRLGSNDIRRPARVTGVSLASTSNSNILWRLRIYKGYSSTDDDTLFGGTGIDEETPSTITYSHMNIFEDSNDSLSFSTNADAIDNAVVLSGFMTNNTDLSLKDLDSGIYLGADIDGNADLAIITVQTLSGTTESCTCMLSWVEYD